MTTSTTTRAPAEARQPQDHKPATGSAVKGKAAKGKAPAKGKAADKGKGKAPAKREAPLDKAIRLQAEALAAQDTLDSLPATTPAQERQAAQERADAAHAEAVLAWMPVPDATMPSAARSYAVKYGGVILSLNTRQADRVTRQADRVEQERKALESARITAARRTQDVVTFVRGSIDTHKLLTAQEFCEQYSVSKSQVSKWRATGDIVSKLSVTSPTRVAALNSAVSHDMAGVRSAVKAEGATFDTVISAARAKRGETTRATQEAARASDETPEREAHRLAVKLTKQITALNNVKGTVADFTDPDVSGYAVMRALLSALSAYTHRVMPDVYGEAFPIPPATYAPGVLAPAGKSPRKGKALPAPHAR